MEKKGILIVLPSEVTLDILGRLPVEWVLECRSWRSLIRRPLFSKMHLRHHLNHPTASDSGKLGFIGLTFQGDENENFRYFEYNENHESIERIRRLNLNLPFGGDTRIVGSSNGLICLSRRYSEDKTCIFNPITREYVMLTELIKRVGMDRWVKGFGYVPSTNEYKVVTVMLDHRSNFVEAYTYTLGSGNGWRNLGEFNYGSKPHLWEQDYGFWMAVCIFLLISMSLELCVWTCDY
ncbi:F-box protein At3g07870-like isoform X3 [Papaver somniferum]|uniref:F-box protein At3g07870-like isoform X3 n=1 Tax=Papaver somniferum TaxID=3469 RepID=UPI000E6F4B0C|nr:F-box protein At3g07870-like isoform X3 [Papaver somniferum]